MRLFIQPYAAGSASARALSNGLRDIGLPNRRLRIDNSEFTYKDGDVVINWGSTRARPWMHEENIINPQVAVRKAADKLTTLHTLAIHDISIPRYTTDYLQALDWIHHDGLTIASRGDLRGHSGKGIVITRDTDHLPKADLFTQFNKSKGEYRIHVFNGAVIDYAKKRRKTDDPPIGIERSIRSHDNGWIFARKNVDGSDIPVPAGFFEESIKAVNALGLHFGAVDVLNVDGSPVILEINTAPGLEGETTRNSYANAFKSFILGE